MGGNGSKDHHTQQVHSKDVNTTFVHQIEGYVKPGFEPVRNAFQEMFNQGYEQNGATFAAYYQGELVVDLWGGMADKQHHRPWQKDTLTMIFSAGKVIPVIVAHMLVDRGLLRYEDPVARYWPQFSKHNKEKITVMQVLNHQAGLAAIDAPITMKEVANADAMATIFQEQAPNWIPGEAVGWHMVTHGWLIDQLCRRSDPRKRTTSQFFHDEVSDQYHLDVYPTLPLKEFYRVARWHPETSFGRTLAGTFRHDFMEHTHHMISGKRDQQLARKMRNNPQFIGLNKHCEPLYDPHKLNLEMPSIASVSNARGLATLYQLFGSGELVRQRSLEKLVQPDHPEVVRDCLLGLPGIFSWGFTYQKSPEGDWELGYPGYGQQGRWNSKRQLAYAHTTSSYHVDEGFQFEAVRNALYQCVKRLPKDYQARRTVIPARRREYGVQVAHAGINTTDEDNERGGEIQEQYSEEIISNDQESMRNGIDADGIGYRIQSKASEIE